MNQLRIVIADDEPLARTRLRRLLSMRDDSVLVGEFADGIDLAEGLAALQTDLILLDIDMPGPNGFGSLEMLSEPKPLVIFVTAFGEHAPRAFDCDAVDYIMKPVSGERLEQAIKKAVRRLRQLAPSDAPPCSRDVLRFETKGRTYLIERSRITSVQSRGNYVEVTTDNQKAVLRTSLTAVLDQLDSPDFVRVHRSWIVAHSAISQINSLPGSRFEIVLKDCRRVPGGRVYAQSIIAATAHHGRSV